MECADNYGGRIRALPGLCTWGYRARTRAARSFKQSLCLLDAKNNGRTSSQYECWCDGHANIVHRRRREEVLGRPLWGKRTKSRMQTYHRYAHNPRASRFRPQCSNDHNLLKYGKDFFKQVPLDESFHCASNASHSELKHSQIMFM
jgi:hypothetical protein